MKKQFKLEDVIDFEVTVIGYFDTMTEVRKAAKEWDEETDGENCMLLRTLNPETGKYKRNDNQRWFF